MPVLQKFMCCCQLRTGAVVIGWIGLVLQLIGLATDSAILANADEIYGQIGIKPGMVKVPLAVSLTSTIISIIAHGMLIWGANSKKRLFLLPWLISTMAMIVISVVMIIILGAIMGSSDMAPGAVAAIIIFGFLFTGIVLYIWICILSLFQELREGGDDVISLTPAETKPPPYTALHESC